MLSEKQLARLQLPIGNLTKAQVREIAASLSLQTAGKADSQDVCFVPNGRYGDVVRRLRPGAIDAGSGSSDGMPNRISRDETQGATMTTAQNLWRN